jgi:hypothetical protein
VIVQIDHVRSFWNPHLETRFFDIWSPMPFKSELISSCCKEAHDAILYHDFFIVVIAHVANTHVVVQSNHHVCKPRMLCLGELIMEWQATQWFDYITCVFATCIIHMVTKHLPITWRCFSKLKRPSTIDSHANLPLPPLFHWNNKPFILDAWEGLLHMWASPNFQAYYYTPLG